MSVPIGQECVTYRNTGTYAAPVWNPCDSIKDLKLASTKGEADVSTRGTGGWGADRGTIKRASIEFNLVFNPADAAGVADFVAIRDAYLTNTPVEFAILDGPIATVGSQGLRATMDVFKFDRPEGLVEAVTYDVLIKPTHAANAPAWVESDGTTLQEVP